MKQLTFDDLVDAYFSATHWAHAHEDLRDYHALRRDILQELFGTKLEFEEPRYGRHDRETFAKKHDIQIVVEMAMRCLEQAARLDVPFCGRLEGAPGPMELAIWTECRQRFREAQAALASEYRVVFRQSLGALFPAARKLSFPETLLFERGLSEEQPDPDDYF